MGAGLEASMKTVTMAEYEEACDDYMGWCPACEKFTRPMTEPDAAGYGCPECDGHDVVGAENALIGGQIEIGDNDEGEV